MSELSNSRRVALVTGASRGIGAPTALTLAEHGYDLAITYRNKATRANEVVGRIEELGHEGLALACDMTNPDDLGRGFAALCQWTDHLDILVLNASGGMERDLVATNPNYPMLINRDAQIALVEAALPLLSKGSTIVFITSHWAHLYGRMQQIPAYEPVAESKFAGEQALRQRQEEFAARGIRLLIVTGDIIEGTITPKLLARSAPGLLADKRSASGKLPTAEEMGRAIALAALNPELPAGSLIVVGAPLEAMLDQESVQQ